ncbi:glycosyltransferase family 2 protein [Zymomonas mobilis]|uniref:Glycosyl transferase family 2 n=1 Tax=Zymomonas mobilis subsp. mobilis (strain ATCC 10988 / DSM 424 / LMG 404 / NCIMB 8938 / NRRL B-806 / ZM1) TaxID=555217 RepID=A0A0H3G117_ZYMMA|nr:glycosyltransferase [Zymomonas mobilis]AEH62388.1 glycosyl transferase family 2 [Zymomonas mobilis subsp. mobilis ATCC 10988]ART93031.1 hypothetical protein B9T50_02265 [Zymomonas mobilis subsp. mobilis]TQL28015.1 glycosyl transferase family 2 [Zymomonas mobilis]TQL29950.1 glycosyl transferase family 2 [Zymomonas mobilis]TWD59703.1 glycosyl transferase family 2 [Zymomonas mobilis]
MNNHEIKISFIVPAYNVKSYLGKCLTSLQQQSLDNFEIIVVEDCSTDGTLSKARQYARKDPRIQIICHKENQGLGPARNTGMEYARGKYICFVDSDDWVDPGYGEAFYLEAERTSADMVVGTFYAVFSQGARIVSHFVDPAVRYASLPFDAQTCPAVLSMPTPVWDKCYRREFLKNYNIRFPALIGEDIPFQWEAMTQAKRISVVGEPFYYYRIRDTKKNRSLTAGRDIFADVFLAQEKALAFLNDSGHYEKLKSIWWERMIKELLHLTDKSGDTLVSDNFVAKVFHTMLRKSLEPVDFSSLNRAYIPEHVLFMAMFAQKCSSWKEFQELVARSHPSNHQPRPRFIGLNKLQMVLTRYDLDVDENKISHQLKISNHNISMPYYPDLLDYKAIIYENNRIIILPPAHDPNMEPARININFEGHGCSKIWYFLSCYQEGRSSELCISQILLDKNKRILIDKKTILHIGEKIVLSFLEIPKDISFNECSFEFSVKCLSGFPAWESDVTISNFYGEGL